MRRILQLSFISAICCSVFFLLKLQKYDDLNLRLKDREIRESSGKGAVAVIAIFRDEAPYLLEWIAYHIQIGVDMFFLYNHGSSDDFYEVLYPLIDAGTVIVTNVSRIFSGTPQEINDAVNHKLVSQIGSIQHWFRTMGTSFEWVVTIDIDEFIFLDDDRRHGLKAFLRQQKFDNSGGIALSRIHFSTNGKEKLLGRDELQTMSFFERRRHDKISREYPKIIFKAAARKKPFINIHSYNGTVGLLHNAAGASNGSVSGFCSECVVPRVENPVVILHYLARSLESCKIKRQLSEAFHGGWRHNMGNDYCDKMHRKSEVFESGIYVRDKKLESRMNNSHHRLCEEMFTLNEKYCTKHNCCSAYGWTAETRGTEKEKSKHKD